MINPFGLVACVLKGIKKAGYENFCTSQNCRILATAANFLP
jgi:hypothetical protein